MECNKGGGPLFRRRGRKFVVKPVRDIARVGGERRGDTVLVAAQPEVGIGIPLHLAAQSGNTKVAELLLANKADVNARDNDGDTPLHGAAYAGYKDVVELLLANKADINAKDNDGDTPLRGAAQRGRGDIVKLLRDKGGHG